jgi:hypothetical protein
MGEIVNLNRFRKARERDAKARIAEENRVRSGRTKETRVKDEDETKRAEETLDDKKLD